MLYWCWWHLLTNQNTSRIIHRFHRHTYNYMNSLMDLKLSFKSQRKWIEQLICHYWQIIIFFWFIENMPIKMCYLFLFTQYFHFSFFFVGLCYFNPFNGLLLVRFVVFASKGKIVIYVYRKNPKYMVKHKLEYLTDNVIIRNIIGRAYLLV